MVHQALPTPSSKALGKRPMRNSSINTATAASVDAVADAIASTNLLDGRAAATANGHAENDSEGYGAAVLLPTVNGRGRDRGRGRGRGGKGRGSSSASSSSATPAAASAAAQKRVLPNRVRRGGPGQSIGTSDVDLSILDMLKRRGENEPLIPSKTVLILTTDSSLVPEPSTIALSVNPYATERYFDRPEVIKAYKAQQHIQTPEFWQLTEKDRVGSRLRTRSGESESVDLSDVAYEKRHRKHELAEKRQRLREKEKLQHEHYKLKERIDQLRSADHTTFLSLPAELFGSPAVSEDETYVPGTSANSHIAEQEGERRRRLMLGVATTLEERYRILLPEKKLQAQEKHPSRAGSPSIVESIMPREDSVSEEQSCKSEAEAPASVTSTRSKPIKLKLRLKPTRTSPSSLAFPSPVVRSQDAISDSESNSTDNIQRRTLSVEAMSTEVNGRATPSTRSRAPSSVEVLSSGHNPEETALPKTAPPASAHVHLGQMQTDVNFMLSFYPDPTKQVPTGVDTRPSIEGYTKQAYPGFDYALSNYMIPNQSVPQSELQVHHLGPEDFMVRPRKKTKVAHGPVERSASALVITAGDSRPEVEVSPLASHSKLQACQEDQGRQTSPLPHEFSWIFEAQRGQVVRVPAESVIERQDESQQLEITTISPPRHRYVVPPGSTTPSKWEALSFRRGTAAAAATVSSRAEYDHAHARFAEQEYDDDQMHEHGISTSSRPQRSSIATEGGGGTSPSSSSSSSSSSLSPNSVSARIYHMFDARPGRGRRRARPPCILVAASHYEGPGRKTGRSTLPFGTELPSFGPETEFELPPWLTEGVDMVALQRAASTETDDGGDMGGYVQHAQNGHPLAHGWESSGPDPGHEASRAMQRYGSSISQS